MKRAYHLLFGRVPNQPLAVLLFPYIGHHLSLPAKGRSLLICSGPLDLKIKLISC